MSAGPKTAEDLAVELSEAQESYTLALQALLAARRGDSRSAMEAAEDRAVVARGPVDRLLENLTKLGDALRISRREAENERQRQQAEIDQPTRTAAHVDRARAG